VKGKDLQKGIIDLAHTYHWHVVHNPTVETKQGWRTALAADAKGFPDLLLFRERVVAIEVKGDGDRLSAEQHDWKDRMINANVEHYVIKPADWPNTVKEILQ
jgi:hypothetical protein